MRILSFAALAFLVATLFPSCQKKSTAPIIPSISLRSFTAISNDSARLEINFTDGDGDIGYPSQDASAQPNLLVRYLYYNYTDQQYEGIRDATGGNYHDSIYFTYNIPDLSPKGKNKSLSGVIEVAMSPIWFYNYYTANTDSNKIEYQVWLYDRAGHISNEITVGPVNVN